MKTTGEQLFWTLPGKDKKIIYTGETGLEYLYSVFVKMTVEI